MIRRRVSGSKVIENLFSPLFVLRTNDHHPESVFVSFHPDAFGVVHVQINTKGRRELRGKTGEFPPRKLAAMPLIVDDAVDPDAMEKQPNPVLKRRAA